VATREGKSGVTIPGVAKRLSRFGLGTSHCKLADRDTYFRLFDSYVEHGGTVFDTARLYAGGESEQVLGAWIRERGVREQVVVVTKGAHGTGWGLDADEFDAAVEGEFAASLDAIETDYVDLYILHRDSPAVPVEQILRKLNALLDRGAVRAFGVSNIQYDRVQEAFDCAARLGLLPYAVISNNVALAVSAEPFWEGLVSVGPTGEQWHARTGVPLLAWSSQARGFFTGRYGPKLREELAGGRLDTFTQRMAVCYCTDENFERLRRATELGKRKGGCSATEVAFAWVLHQPSPVLPLVGARTPDEVASCARAASLELTQDEVAWLNLRRDDV